MRANVKPLTHWAIYKGYTLRFSRRDPEAVEGIIGTATENLPFLYAPATRILRVQPHTPTERVITLNEYGWEESGGEYTKGH